MSIDHLAEEIEEMEHINPWARAFRWIGGLALLASLVGWIVWMLMSPPGASSYSSKKMSYLPSGVSAIEVSEPLGATLDGAPVRFAWESVTGRLQYIVRVYVKGAVAAPSSSARRPRRPTSCCPKSVRSSPRARRTSGRWWRKARTARRSERDNPASRYVDAPGGRRIRAPRRGRPTTRCSAAARTRRTAEKEHTLWLVHLSPPATLLLSLSPIQRNCREGDTVHPIGAHHDRHRAG